jgi:peptidoglycan hydrolase-like protein with peptidoglycan-binding domain
LQSAGPTRKELQTQPRNAGVSPGAIDGAFGQATERALRTYQEGGLIIDGVAGLATWRALIWDATSRLGRK